MVESVQKKLLRVRPPRVRITYDVHTGGAIEKRELPFIAGIFADLSGERDPLAVPVFPPTIKERKMVDIDRDNFNEVLRQSLPRLSLRNVDNVIVPNPDPTKPVPKLAKPITFGSLADFDPIRVIDKIDATRDVFAQRKLLREVQARSEVNDAIVVALDEVCTELDTAGAWSDAIGTKVNAALADSVGSRVDGFVTAFKERVAPLFAGDKPAAGKSSSATLDMAVSYIDQALSAQLSLVMHDDEFKKLEATWRSLFYLVSRSETGTRLKLRVFNATLAELRDDMDKAVEFDQSHLFKLIYEAEYGTFGGAPYSLLVGGYEIGPNSPDILFLRKMAEVGAASHAPFITAAAPTMFGLDSFGSLAKPRDLAKIFEGADLAAWSEFRDSEDSRYVTLVLPRVLLRQPYGEKTLPADGFNFEEQVSNAAKLPDNSRFLWGNASYFLAERITNAFSIYSWTAAIRGVEGGGLVEGLPIYTFSTSDDVDGITEMFCPTEVAITDRREKELNDMGFIALCHCKGSGKAAFFGGQTSNKPKKYINDDANANAALSSRLPYILAASRFAHYIKVIVRDKVGGFLTRGNVEAYLNTWISQYVLLDDNASQEVKASFPLRAAQIIVVEVPGAPGSYTATVFLKPHFQLEELTTSIRLVAELPK
ncbi:MAG: EvpB/family type secretion protein [Rhodocyclales bacterium]|nr:EvpB/family type secretion protein [Rhodocyclales bacterium]MDB5888598.1 EvpB/family type secretion protein [Rhodocyclales bacterium]